MRSLLMPPAWTAPLPAATLPVGMALYQLTGTYATRAALAIKGGSFADTRHFAATGVLVGTRGATC